MIYIILSIDKSEMGEGDLGLEMKTQGALVALSNPSTSSSEVDMNPIASWIGMYTYIYFSHSSICLMRTFSCKKHLILRILYSDMADI